MKLIGFLLLFGFSTSLGAEKARFDFYRLYEVQVENELQLEVFKQISEYPDGYCFMASPPSTIDSLIQFIVPPHKFAEWNDLVSKYALHVSLITNNLQDLFEKQENRNRFRKATERFDWSNFRTLEEIRAWLRELAAGRPNDLSTFIAGISYEGREMLGLRINIGNVAGKKSIFFESNIHANEWIGASSQTYIMNELLTSSDADVQDLLNRFEWYFLPVLNVDGYSYTWNVDRTWRKTRGPTKNLLCRGADPNRNWDLYWSTSGSSDNPCGNTYHGDRAFSEPETLQLAQFMQTVPNLFGYISFHSYGQLLMLPYSYTRNVSAVHDLLMDIGQTSLDDLSTVRGRNYRIGTINDFFGNTAGSSVDYIQVNNNPLLTYCYEINSNHILPPEEIIPTAQELFASVKTIFLEAVTRGLA